MGDLDVVLRLELLIMCSLVFHYTHNAGKPSPYSSKDMHISTVSFPTSRHSKRDDNIKLRQKIYLIRSLAGKL